MFTFVNAMKSFGNSLRFIEASRWFTTSQVSQSEMDESFRKSCLSLLIVLFIFDLVLKMSDWD